MRWKLNYVVIPLIVFATAFVGSLFVMSGLKWYDTIKLPDFTPPSWAFGIVWTFIFIVCADLIILIWNCMPRGDLFRLVVNLFILNAALNILWNVFFFSWHWMLAAAFDSLLLTLDVAALIVLIRDVSREAALLLVPYVFWVAFATYLTFDIWLLNR